MPKDKISDDDKALFREQMKDVSPLKKSPPKNKDTAPSPKTLVPKKHLPKAAVPIKEYFLSDYISETVQANSFLSYKHPSVANKRFSLLKRGHIQWERKLDLHGLATEAAREALSRFISSTSPSIRCVLIVHGKGGQDGTPPVIKNLVNRWLPQMNEVLAFHSALPKDGGEGAVYVLIKKQDLP